MNPYRTITGRAFDVTAFSPKEKELFTRLVKEYERNPDWETFSTRRQDMLRGLLAKLPATKRIEHPLYRIAQDLEMRLGIAQGAVAEPDYRDYLVDRIEEKFGSRYRFCKETGIPEAFVSQVLSGKKDFSIEMLARAAKALDLGLALLPKGDLADMPLSDFSALRRVCAVVSAELASLESLRDHLQRTEKSKRTSALRKERTLLQGALDDVIAEIDRLPEDERGEAVFGAIDRKKSDLEALLSLLRGRLASQAEDTARRKPFMPTV